MGFTPGRVIMFAGGALKGDKLVLAFIAPLHLQDTS